MTLRATDTTLQWLRIARSHNIGPRIFKNLIEVYGSASRILDELPRLIERQNNTSRKWSMCSEESAKKELECIKNANCELLTWESDKFPKMLLRLFDPPPVLTVKSDKEIDFNKCIAVVGARNSSANGYYFTKKIASDIADAGYVIVSGMARGIDRAAHEGAISNGGSSVAFLAGGIDVVYPKENQSIYDAIPKTGAIYSEMPWSTQPNARLFPRRNRLIASSSLAIVVIECAMNSGSMLTAKHALDLGIDVFSVPGSPLDSRGRGCNHLIKEGADLVESSDDILSLLADQTSIVQEEEPPFSYVVQEPPSLDDVTSAKEELLSALADVPVAFDLLVDTLQFSASTLRIALIELEIDEKILRDSGDFYCLNLSKVNM